VRVSGPGRRRARALTSPGYPEPYPAHAACAWVVSARRAHLLRVSVDQLDVEPTDRCLFDFLEVRRAGGRRAGEVLARYCGSREHLHPAAASLNTTGIGNTLSYK